MLSFEQDGCRFNYRVAGVAFRNDEVLLHKGQNDDFWTLPGGRVEMGESSEVGFKREMREELAIEVEVTRLLWVVENFFEYDNRPYHEVAFYYLFLLPDDCLPLTMRERFRGCEANTTIEFQWYKLSELSLVRLLPSFLADGLKSLPCHPVHIVHRDE